MRAEKFHEESWNRESGAKQLDLRDALIVTCGYMRTNITEEVWRDLRVLSQSSISRYIGS